MDTGTTGTGDIEDIAITVDADAVAVPINAYALGSPAYSVLDVRKTNPLEDQIELVEGEVDAGRDPTNALSAAQTEIHLIMRPLTSISSIARTIRVTATLLDSPMGYDAGAN